MTQTGSPGWIGHAASVVSCYWTALTSANDAGTRSLAARMNAPPIQRQDSTPGNRDLRRTQQGAGWPPGTPGDNKTKTPNQEATPNAVILVTDFTV